LKLLLVFVCAFEKVSVYVPPPVSKLFVTLGLKLKVVVVVLPVLPEPPSELCCGVMLWMYCGVTLKIGS
jgi:hypothetical protein